MKTNDPSSANKLSGIMRALSIVLAALLLLSVIFLIIFIVRGSRINTEKEQVEAKWLTLFNDHEQLQAEKSESNLQIADLKTKLHESEIASQELLKARDARIASLGRQSRELEALRKQVEAYREMEVDYNKVREQHNQLIEKFENLGQKHNSTLKQYTLLQDSVEQARDLHVYHIHPLTKWERWLWADRYHVDIARRVDQTRVSFELAGSVFAPHGSRTIYLSMHHPDGTVMVPAQKTLAIHGADNQVQYTTKQEIHYSGSPIPVTFTIDHPERLSPGKYSIMVYIGNELIRSEQMHLK